MSTGWVSSGNLLQILNNRAVADSNVCNTQVCLDTASTLLHDLDLNIDPCSDFYGYTCGGWIKDSKIPASESAVGTFANLRNDNMDVLSKLLESTYNEIIQPSNNIFIDNQTTALDYANFDKLKTYYQSCMNEDRLSDLGPTPIYADLENLFNKSQQQSLTDIIAHLAKEGIDNFFSFSVGPDDRFPDENSIFITQPSLGLPTREYFNQSDIIDTYRTGLYNVLQVILGSSDKNDEDSTMDQLRRTEMNKHQLMMLDEQEVKSIVDQFIELETQLAQLTLPKEEMQDPIALYNPMTLTELQKSYSVVNWRQLLQQFLPTNVTVPERVIVNAPRYMQPLSKWLSTLPQPSLRDFFTVKLIMANIGRLDQMTREVYRKMRSKISSGTTAPPQRSRICLSEVNNNLGQLLGRYFILHKFGEDNPEQMRIRMGEFIHNLLTTWTERLKNLDWLDDETKTKALDKVSNIKHKEAYNIVHPDVRSSQSLADYYAGIEVNADDFYGNQKSMAYWNLKQEWDRVGQAVDKKIWYMYPHEVNAYYAPSFNEIVVPVGILQSPFYDQRLPLYMNYGGIGSVIGHEITHAFDNSGRLYDGQGRLDLWWTNATSEAFEDKSQCFINQYSQFTVQGPDNTTHNVNGKMTLGENLADNGGLRASYMAMQQSLKDHPEDNPSLSDVDFTPEQLFFINFGRIWCMNTRPEMAVQRIRSDPHSPNRVRVNAAVQNNPDFAQAFHCQTPTDMNPAQKCEIW
ncbi:MAG: hypothetical protein EXX96DRAFT_487084 [Benjaminiella poitrasii]|nr:MAG: hypothetical protein EXX96DRAFT_487084 [Benjaminiella poitrasii]